ncbi:hypothetical protein [Rhizobium sp. RU36D]|uniref:hypothetical protein n=1 Tax=Rhizobium sp. RU36D TaxID=1907415 RepID=UPI0009D865D5|nr:hypothetical protein [Rhizobium sp. RU36D]SMD16301.1 hypothetical protein SAMN05880593_12927 [Rhizobium sp. RU36D]
MKLISIVAVAALMPSIVLAQDPKLIVCQGLDKDDAGRQVSIQPLEGKGSYDIKDADGSFSVPLECATGTDSSAFAIVCHSRTDASDGSIVRQTWSIPNYTDSPARTVFSILISHDEKLTKDHVAAISIYDSNCKAM